MSNARERAYAAVRRFPILYKRQAEHAIDLAVHETSSKTADAMVISAMIVLIKEFRFGTKPDSTRLNHFMEALGKLVDDSADKYDDAVVIGLRNQLHNLGVEYTVKEG